MWGIEIVFVLVYGDLLIEVVVLAFGGGELIDFFGWGSREQVNSIHDAVELVFGGG